MSADDIGAPDAFPSQGIASPPEPAYSLMIVAFGPKMASCGW
jgi:hypothetical protein